MKSFTAHTSEVDDAQVAVAEILAQIDLAALEANTVGIIACHYEFVFSGVAEAICQALPFEVTGTISSTQASDQAAEVFQLALLILTGDDVSFKTVLTDSLLENPDAAIRAAYAKATTGDSAQGDAQPGLILIHGSFIPTNSGDCYLQTINELSGGCPLFGALAVDDTLDFRHSYAIHNGIHYNDRLLLTLIYGAVKPRFYVANVSPSKIIGAPAQVTAAADQLLKGVNDRPIYQYLAELGLAEVSETQYAMSSLPFFLDYGDGTPPVSRVFIMLTPDGDAVLNGSAPVGTTLTVAAFDKEDVLLTTGEALEHVLSDAHAASPTAVLAYSCIARNMSLGAEQLLEAELVRDRLAGELPYLMGYAGGEFSPMSNEQLSSAANRFHNNTFIVCVF